MRGIFAAFSLLAVLCGCDGSGGAPPAGNHAAVDLPVRWTQGAELRGETQFYLEETAGAGTRLHLEGFWWRVALVLDGEPLPPAFPGYAPLDLALPALAAGEHHLDVTVSPPTDGPPVVSLPNGNRLAQAGTITLRLQASAALQSIAIPLLEGSLQPSIVVHEPPPGSTIELMVSRDGAPLARWEPQPVGMPFAALRFEGEAWAIGQPSLYLATATLRDAAGRTLSERSERVGFREAVVKEGVLYLNQVRTPLFAVRGQMGLNAAVAAAVVAAGGLNAVELHGTVPTAGWLARHDELGLPVVHLPRCDGGLWKPGENEQTTRAAHAETLAEQESRLLVEAASHPSILAWACEGSDSLRVVACGGLRRDPLARPVFGVDLTATSIASTFAPPARGPTWVIEVGQSHGGALPIPATTAAAFLRGIGAWAVGGVVPAPKSGEDAAWAAAWAAAAAEVGAPPWRGGPRRRMSAVVVDGLEPGQIATLYAPYLAPTGAAADDAGRARIEVWYAGEATLVRPGGQVSSVSVAPP